MSFEESSVRARNASSMACMYSQLLWSAECRREVQTLVSLTDTSGPANGPCCASPSDALGRTHRPRIHHQPEAQHPNLQLSTSSPADCPICSPKTQERLKADAGRNPPLCRSRQGYWPRGAKRWRWRWQARRSQTKPRTSPLSKKSLIFSNVTMTPAGARRCVDPKRPIREADMARFSGRNDL
jgi:hypothetical protein